MTATMTKPARKPARKTPRYSRMGFKPAEVTIVTEAGTSALVPAFQIGLVAIHRQFHAEGDQFTDPNPKKRAWVITHAPTGMAVPRKFKYRKDAEKVARVFARACHGVTKNPAGTVRGQLFWKGLVGWIKANPDRIGF